MPGPMYVGDQPFELPNRVSQAAAGPFGELLDWTNDPVPAFDSREGLVAIDEHGAALLELGQVVVLISPDHGGSGEPRVRNAVVDVEILGLTMELIHEFLDQLDG